MYNGYSLIRNRTSLGPYSRTMQDHAYGPVVILGRGALLTSEVPIQAYLLPYGGPMAERGSLHVRARYPCTGVPR